MSSELNPIGVFDSGYGGLTILKEFIDLMPEYDYFYLGDNARSPYGPRSFDAVYSYTLEAVNKLFEMGCHIIILACNTASAKALRTIQQNDLPKIDHNKRVLGVIRPSVEAIGKYTLTNNIGILGTRGTVISNSYPLEIAKLFPNMKVNQEACPMWVPLVENDEFNMPGADYFIEKNINSLLKKNNKIDSIILGCTHYPLLSSKIKKYLPPNIKLLSQGKIVAESLKDYLLRHPEIEIKCTKSSIYKFFTTDNPTIFKKQGRKFCDKITDVRHINL
ncbi:MAG: glutamate racemase [Bacteroidetes bacterium 4572_117]|nr:MAG: glutamate racemase [Bacteroidetes bacterium 4572_117]